MQEIISLKILPEEAFNPSILKKVIADTKGLNISAITGWHTLKRSLDARGKTVWVNLSVNVFINEPFRDIEIQTFHFKDVSKAEKKVIIIGAGPAGLFAALSLIELGIKPIILERGKDVRSRRRDLALLNKEGILNPESNYCFGEGGAGTYSDGKLYTRSNKRGDIKRILNLFVHFGADHNILFDAHPHIGTNKLPQIITSMRKTIEETGGEVHFNKKVVDFVLNSDEVTAVKTQDGDTFCGHHYILATGHSAGDIYELLYNKKILISSKPFALGVRVEHPQSIIDNIQYYGGTKNILPPASYSLVEQIGSKGVFSFCMCPGGIIAPASSSIHELVVNGWSPSKRNNPFANSGMVVQVEEKDAKNYFKKNNISFQENSPLLLHKFQKHIESEAFKMGGGKYVAPAQRMVDFVNKKPSSSLPDCSYLPGIKETELHDLLPDFVSESLAGAFKKFNKKMPSSNSRIGYFTNEAILVGVESRTSSAVRIPRDEISLCHPQLKNLSPCAEGAGYAGGIVSAAMDGENVANKIYSYIYK
ncbi:MAG: FAD-binding protein [Ginsengibacter sp.]